MIKVRACGMYWRGDCLLTLVYHYPKGHIYALPGGGLDEGETLAEAVVREFREEVGVEASVGELKYVADMPGVGDVPQRVHVVFEVKAIEGEPELNRQETSAADIAWLSKDRLAEVQLYPDIKKALVDDAADNSGRARYLGNSMSRDWA